MIKNSNEIKLHALYFLWVDENGSEEKNFSPLRYEQKITSVQASAKLSEGERKNCELKWCGHTQIAELKAGSNNMSIHFHFHWCSMDRLTGVKLCKVLFTTHPHPSIFWNPALTHSFIHAFTDWLTDWLDGWLVAWFISSLSDWQRTYYSTHDDNDINIDDDDTFSNVACYNFIGLVCHTELKSLPKVVSIFKAADIETSLLGLLLIAVVVIVVVVDVDFFAFEWCGVVADSTHFCVTKHHQC